MEKEQTKSLRAKELACSWLHLFAYISFIFTSALCIIFPKIKFREQMSFELFNSKRKKNKKIYEKI